MTVHFASSAVSLLICFRCLAAEPAVDPDALPRVPPVEATNALSTFQIKPGFRMDLVAAEPLVVDPIAMAFDENNRLFVIEMRDYSERRQEQLGRVRLLEDVDGDGFYDKSTVFAQNLAWPTAIICYDGGVFVGATPEILYLKDQNGDNVADERRVIFTGFADTGERLNVQGLMNSFHWTLDNRIQGATGLMGGRIRNSRGKALDLRGKDFSFDPRNPDDIRAESGGGQHGLTFTDDGRKLICHNSAHIKLVMYDDRYATRNPYYSMPAPVIDIPVDGPAAEVYRISPVEPWRVLRTAWRVAGKVSGPVEGGGRAAGYFTSATGITVYRGDAFPKEYQGDAFIADVGSNLIHRKKLLPKGVALEARRPDDEQNVEFIASKDLWFRPVQFANAPDGCLYLADMYREIVEHPWSIPESIKQHLDLNSGNDRGRIYRIAPKTFKPVKALQLGKKSTAELIPLLGHPNGWTRDSVARLLYQRQDLSCVPALEKLAHDSRNPLGRMHALYTLAGQNALPDAILVTALGDGDARVREHAIRLSEARPLMRRQLRDRANDPSARVRFQLAFTLGAETPRLPASDYEDAWIRAAVLNSYSNSQIATQALNAGPPREFATALAEIVGAANTADHPRKLAEQLNENLVVAAALARGLERAGSSIAKLEPEGERLLARAAKCLGDGSESNTRRVDAAELLGYGASVDPSLCQILAAPEAEPLQSAALNALGRLRDESVGPEILKHWKAFTPRLRAQALSILLARTERITPLLKAIEGGIVDRSEISSMQIKQLIEHRQPSVREGALKVLAQINPPKRKEVMDQYRAALALPGHAGNGLRVYQERCLSCHRLGKEGHQLGPDLITVKAAGKEKVLESILDPNREVLPQYVAQLIETKAGDSHLGIIANENANNVTLREAFGKETVIPRAAIQKIQSQRQSMMPEGLEAGMTQQQMADLLEFIASASPN